MTAMKTCLLTLSLLLAMSFDRITGYSMEEILNDFYSIDFNQLVKYRGPILKDVWVKNGGNAHQELEVCQALFRAGLKTVNVTWPPPKEMPSNLKDDFLLGGKSDLLKGYTAEQQNGGTGYNWNTKVMEEKRKHPNICGPYNTKDCDKLTKRHSNFIRGQVGIVVGSQTPWAEAALFNAGASSITTIEYMQITTDYPNYRGIHPSKAAEMYLSKQWHLVDFAWSFSSLEHDGLGRYGDPINPFGDLESLARIRCLLKPGGILFLSVPVAPDAVTWNAHRMYGKYRLGLFLLGWRLLDISPEDCDVTSAKAKGNFVCSPLLVLEKAPHKY